ncbi:MAG: RNA chaperone Hfq [Candidatus Cloacimonadota bacterium]|nr:MAG: RNA chaperone Hfq [Candidatus Cloacimonadota bacterium]
MTNKSKVNIQDQLLYQARKEQIPLKIYLLRGLMLQGKVVSYDAYSVLIKGMGRFQLIFKHAISTIDFPEGMQLAYTDNNNKDS